MSKTLVNIITEDEPIANYLFVKEMYQEGDRFMFISAKDTEEDMDEFSEFLNIPQDKIEEILLKSDADELTWEKMCRLIRSHLDTKTDYWVNLAGGTKFMAMAVQSVFEKFNARFFYIPEEENVIVNSKFDDILDNNDDYFYPINYRMNVREYLAAHGIQSTGGDQPILSEYFAQGMFDLFSQQLLPSHFYETLDVLRTYRNRRQISVNLLENPTKPNCLPVPHLSEFLEFIKFPFRTHGLLCRSEIEYLTGGWFEEYVYYLIKKYVKTQDLMLNLLVFKKGSRHQNELDVVFTKGNKLFVVECKSGVDSQRMFNEIVYKACALKEALFGIACNSYIFSLKKDLDGELKKTANKMEITFCDHEMLTGPKIKKCLKQMSAISFDDMLQQGVTLKQLKLR